MLTERNSIHTSLNRLTDVLMETHDQLAKLLEVLNPVMTPQPPQPANCIGAGALVDELKSPLEHMIDEKTQSVIGLRNRITQAIREVSL